MPRFLLSAASIQIQKVATINSDRKKINLIPNKSANKCQYFLTSSFIADISEYFFFHDLIVAF